MSVPMTNASRLPEQPGSNTTSPDPPALVLGIRYACIPVWSILLCFGLFGNALTVFVLRAKRLQQSSTSIYLTALAITDVFYLLTSLVASIANFIFFFPSEVRQVSHTFCVLTPFLHYTLAYISVWLLVAVTVERAIWVVLPFRARRICTKRTARIVVGTLILAFTLLDTHFFVTMRYMKFPKEGWVCSSTKFTDKVLTFLDLLLVAVLPCTIMLVANCLIGWKLRTMRKFRQAHGAATNQAAPDQNALDKREKSTHLTRMLVSTNVFFIISVTPLLVYDVVFFSVDVRAWAVLDEDVRGGMLFAIERLVYTLWYTNFAIHFLLYCLSGPPFRAEVLVLCNRVRACLSRRRDRRPGSKQELNRVPLVDGNVSGPTDVRKISNRVEESL